LNALGDVVLVTIQYRLGAFGFLALDTPDVPGNAGFKDQNLALKWIKINIKRFGGDPDKVTFAGLSAGAHSVTAHMISPMSEGLFNNVIAVSGALPWQKKLKSTNINSGKALAVKVSCPVDNINTMTQCLISVSSTLGLTFNLGFDVQPWV
jgi:acetylcholinesterase